MGKVGMGGGSGTKLMLAFKGIWTENLQGSNSDVENYHNKRPVLNP